MSELGRDEDTPRRDWEREIYKREEAQMTEPTPRTDNPETGYRSHYAEHEHNRELCRSLERQCARQFALLRRWVESAKRDDACDLTCLIIESERELKG